MKKEPVIKEILVNATATKVWKAITDKEDMKHWYFPVEEFRTELGFEFTLYGEKDDRKYPIACRIISVELNKKLSYTWNYRDFPAETIVTFELFEEGSQTKVRLTHEGLEKIPEKYKDASKENHREGWNHIIGSSLKEYAEKK